MNRPKVQWDVAKEVNYDTEAYQEQEEREGD